MWGRRRPRNGGITGSVLSPGYGRGDRTGVDVAISFPATLCLRNCQRRSSPKGRRRTAGLNPYPLTRGGSVNVCLEQTIASAPILAGSEKTGWGGPKAERRRVRCEGALLRGQGMLLAMACFPKGSRSSA